MKYRIKDNINLEELKKYYFIQDNYFTVLNRPVHKDYILQSKKNEYILILKNRAIVKGKLTCILDLSENMIDGYKIQTDNVKPYIDDLIQADLVEKVDD